MALLKHGGGLHRAAAEYDIPYEQWLDLSTGLNPAHYPVAEIPADCWQRLPEEEDGLLEAAVAYYGNNNLLAVAGSQVAIQSLPRLRQKSRVGYFQPAYAEHAWNWQQAGHEMIELKHGAVSDEVLQSLDVILVVNPTNPSAYRFTSEELRHWHQQLKQRDGWLIVDEAFMDVTPEQSLLNQELEPGLIVLRSLGKFFGLAGLRLGFVFAWPTLLDELKTLLGPWHINHPARWLAKLALEDFPWHAQTRQQLSEAGERLGNMIQHAGLNLSGVTPLFVYVEHPQAKDLHQQLAREGILTRLFDEPSAIRFGLPGDEPQWQRLQTALVNLKKNLT